MLCAALTLALSWPTSALSAKHSLSFSAAKTRLRHLGRTRASSAPVDRALIRTMPSTLLASEQTDSYRFIDIGANLLDDVYSGRYHGGSQKHEPDLDAVIERATKSGVEKIMVTAGTLEESRRALELAKAHPSLYSTVGVHPTRCSEFSTAVDPETHLASLKAVLEEGKACGKRGVRMLVLTSPLLLMSPCLAKVVAVGECGLDYDRLHFCDKDEQAKGFELQFNLAEHSGLPVFFHSRACRVDFASLVRRNRDRFSGGVVHSFTGTKAEMEELVDMGLYIGINGCSLKTEENLEVVRSIPADKLMVETDAPWCEIRPAHAGTEFVRTTYLSRKRDKFEKGLCVKGRVEPCHIIQVLEVVAGVRGEDPGIVASTAFDNTLRLFFPEESS